MMDATVANHGTLFTFDLLTDEAREWVDAEVDVPSYMWLGGRSFACEHRFALDIAMGMMEAGLSVGDPPPLGDGDD